MMKFFRKHNRKLLAVFMAALLVVWLGGSALQSLISPSYEKRILATTDLGDIVELDRRVAEFETGLLENLGLNWQRPWPFGQVAHEPLSVYEWIILTREANEWGMAPRHVEIESFLGQFGLTQQHVDRLAFQQDVKADHIYSAIGKFMGVFNTISTTIAAFTPSEAEIRVAARDELEKVKIKLVSLNAKTFVDPEEAFTDEEIRAHFELFKGSEHGNGIKFGYYQPAKIKVQYLSIDASAVAEKLRVRSRTLEDRAHDFWRENKTSEEFRRPAPSEEEQVEGPDQPESPYFETFEEAREAALIAVRNQIATEEVNRIAEWLLQRLSDPWDILAVGSDGYKAGTPELTDATYYEEVIASMPSRLQYEDAIVIEVSDFFVQDEAHQVPGISAARAQLGTSQRFFRSDAFLVQGVETIPDDARIDRSRYLAVGQSSSVAYRNYEGDAYVFRVIEVQPAGPCEDLEQVREQVIEDLRLLKGFERAQDSASSLSTAAASATLEAAWNADEALKGMTDPSPGFYTPQPIARRRAGLPMAPTGVEFRTTTYVAGLGSITQPVIEQFFELEQEPTGQRVDVFPIDERAVVAVVEWEETIPVRINEYESERQAIVQRLNDAVVRQRLSQWLDPVRIRDRHRFQMAIQ